MHGALPKIKLPDGRTVESPHHEWAGHNLRWRWLLDSYEGGECYRNAAYGVDSRGQPVRNLIRHKREYPGPLQDPYGESGTWNRPDGTDPYTNAGDDDYELRRARTPVPTFLPEAIEAHLSRIFSQEVRREGPADLTAWWEDVDGCGTSVDQWMGETVAPLLLTYGQLDLLFDHPKAPEGAEIRTQADVLRLDLGRCVASVVLPENVAWWTLDERLRYREVIVKECGDAGDRWRYIDALGSRQYDEKGRAIGERMPHPFGRVPMVRVFDRRRPRCRNVGLPRYEAIAEIQREFYNRDSELILSDTTQAHPLLQGPEDFVQADGSIPVGPAWLLPMKKNAVGDEYTGFEVVDFPKGAAESIRLNKQDLREAADRNACLTKPAGASGTGKGTVAQTGVSKRLDLDSGNRLLSKVAAVLERAELTIVEFVLCVLSDGKTQEVEPGSVEIAYPRRFDLATAEELADLIERLGGAVALSGDLPATEGRLLKQLVRLMLPGLEDAEYAEMDAEIDAAVKARGRERAAGRLEAGTRQDDLEDDDEPAQDAGADDGQARDRGDPEQAAAVRGGRP